MRLTYCPFAKRTAKEMPTQGEYRKGHPEGAVVHYTAGRHNLTAIDSAIANGLSYFLITHDGTVYQGAPLNRWGVHAGKSAYPGLGKGVSQYLVGIELTNAGLLSEKGLAWFGQPVSDSRRIKEPRYQGEAPGLYEAYTTSQEKSLFALLQWLKSNAPDVFSYDFVVGHNEVCVPAGRKQDPGGALSMSMPALREALKRAR